MTTQTISEDSVASYLKQNNDFFNRNTELLKDLEISHQADGAVSLIERQVSIFGFSKPNVEWKNTRARNLVHKVLRGGRDLRPRLRVKVNRVDMDTRRIDFRPVDEGR